jgi:epoxyqueuosine reductase
VLIAIGNSGEAALAEEARRLLGDESPLVRGAAVWALGQLVARQEFEALGANAISNEHDDSVREEWQAAS